MKTVTLFVVMVFLASPTMTALPAAASDYTLNIFGNANMDDTIDEDDIEYVEEIIDGTDEETELADANYDGRIDESDITQIELVIIGEEKELTIVDSADRVVTVPKPVESIIPLTSDQVEVLRSIGATDKIIGINDYVTELSSFFPEFVNLPSAGGYEPDLEVIVELRPDIVMTTNPQKLEDSLDGNDIVFIGFKFYTPSTMKDEILKLGYLLDKKNEAEHLIEYYESVTEPIEDVVSEISDDQKKRVYYEWCTGTYKAYGSDTGGHEALTSAGAINIAAELTGCPTVDPEWVTEQNPDIILKNIWYGECQCGYETENSTYIRDARDEIMNRPELANVNAVKDEKVFVICYKIGASPQYPVGMAYMAKWFYPERFENLDPHVIHTEYLERVQGVPYQGVYVCPPFGES